MTIHTSTQTQHTEGNQPDRQFDDRRRVFQIVSLLLQYPEEEWFDCKMLCEEITEIQNSNVKQCLFAFVEYLESSGLEEAMIQYVNTFDFNSKAALYLTYSNKGEERERGESLLKLKKMYEQFGLVMTDRELSDYLPLFLEFAAIAPESVAIEACKDYREAIKAIQDALQSIDSPYFSLLQASLITIDEIIQAYNKDC